MPRFFQRNKNKAETSTTTPVKKSNVRSGGTTGGGVNMTISTSESGVGPATTTTPSSSTTLRTPNTVMTTGDMSRMTMTTPGSSHDNDNDDDSNGSEVPWDVIQASFSEDGDGSDVNSATMMTSSSTSPTPGMKLMIQERMNRHRLEEGGIGVGVGGATGDDYMATTSTTLTSYSQEEEVVVRLPSKILRSSQRSTIPLSLPSTAGTSQDEEHRDKAELDPEELENMPEDEKKQYLQTVGMCGFMDVASGTGEELGGPQNLCDYTMSALNEFCGLGPSTTIDDDRNTSSPPPQSKKPDPVGTRSSLSPRSLPPLRAPYGVEEQTAIEVEYIEPDCRQDVKSDISTGGTGGVDAQTKNRLVQAMARRAKQDFEKKRGKPATVSSPTPPIEERDVQRELLITTTTTPTATSGMSTSPPPPDNVYSSFSSAEKRMFLKLINSGLTPSDATAQVLKEREQGQNEVGTPGGGVAETTSTEKIPLWKSAPARVEALGTISPTTQMENQGGNDNFAKSGIGYYDGDHKDAMEMAEDSVSDEAAAAESDRRTPKTRIARLAKFGFGRSKGQEIPDNDDNDDRGDDEGEPIYSTRDPPPDPSMAVYQTKSPSPEQQQQQQQQSSVVGMTGPPPTGILPNEDVLRDLIAVAESRSVFKPISPRSPEPEEDMASPPPEDLQALSSTLSNDSLFEDDDGQVEIQTSSPPAVKESEMVLPMMRSAMRNLSPGGVAEQKEDMTQGRMTEEDIVAKRLLGGPRGQQVPVPASPPRTMVATTPPRTMVETTPPRTMVETTPPRTMVAEVVDLDIETAYMNSTELLSSQYSGASVRGDQTDRTQGTHATSGTNYTTSTRSRRPGASKQRLTSQKTGKSVGTSQKYKGWQASIQEAAAGIGKVWDPVKGWVGYEDPEDEKKDDTFESMPVEQPSVGSSSQSDQVQTASSVSSPNKEASSLSSASDRALASSVATPYRVAAASGGVPSSDRALAASVGSSERALASSVGSPDQAMLSAVASPDSLAVLGDKESPQTKMTRSPAAPPRQGTANLKKNSTTPVKSRGWKETMKEATAKLNHQGQRWDPDRGWVGTDDDATPGDVDRYRGAGIETQIESDTQDFGTIQNYGSPSNVDRYQSAGVETQAESDTQDFGMIQHSPQAMTSQASQHQPLEPGGHRPINSLAEDPSTGTTENQQGDETSSDVQSLDYQSVDTSLKSAANGRYIQLGDTGSVASYYYGNPSNKATPTKGMGAMLASTPEGHDEDEGSAIPPPKDTLLVNVNRGLAAQTQASLTPDTPNSGRGSRMGTGPVDLDDEDIKEEPVMYSEAPSSNLGSRRGTGPVDLDDEDYDDDDDDDGGDNAYFADAQGFSWDEDDFGNATGAKKKLADAKSIGSVSTIPRLPAPKRDTSPIRGRGANSNISSPHGRRMMHSQQVTPSPQQEVTASPEVTSTTPGPSMKSKADPVAVVTPPAAAQPMGYGPDRSIRQTPPPPPPPAPKSAKTPVSATKSRSDPVPMVTPPSAAQPVGHGPDRSLRQKTPSPPMTQTEMSPDGVNNVRDLHQYWEKRSTDNPISPPNAEWKSFLSKKVMAENAAVENRKKFSNTGEDDRDTLFDFGSESAYSSAAAQLKAHPNRSTDPGLRQLEQISNLSPIRTVHDDDEDDDDDTNAPSEVGTDVVQGKTFLERIQACATPIFPKQFDAANCNPMPLAHLNFMRRNAAVSATPDAQPQSRSASKLAPKTLYGKPDVIQEEEEDEDTSASDSRNPGRRTPQKTPPARKKGDVSSVISDEQFGQKTAYLEAIAMKAAVSGSKKTRRTRSSGGSETGSAEIKHSESWQRFLDKKNAATSEDQESVQRAAEEYAAKKFDQMMSRNRPTTTDFEARPMEEATGAFPSVKNVNRFKGGGGGGGYITREWKTESTKAAEELAAARVEAMMQSLSSKRTLEEDEGEI